MAWGRQNNVPSNLPARRSGTCPNIIHRQSQALTRLSVTLLPHLADKRRERHLGLHGWTELSPTQGAIALDHRLHEEIGGHTGGSLDNTAGCYDVDGRCHYH